jgi:hypothetical protein
MGKYGDCAVHAVKLIENKHEKEPRLAWNLAASSLMESEAMKNKGCPRAAFLGLCEEGMIKGIPKGRYTRSTKNKGYALNAIKILQQTSKPPTRDELWREITGYNIVHNGQMDVVLSLWHNGLILK